MRAQSVRETGPNSLRRSLERLDGLPMRPTSARQILASYADDDEPGLALLPECTEIDTSWALELTTKSRVEPLACLADRAWWKSPSRPPATEALNRLWRHSAAVAFAARRLGRESNDIDPEGLARAGLLANLGVWAIASIDVEWLGAWLSSPDIASRRHFERQTTGAEVSSLGRSLAIRWGCPPIVADAAWLHADQGSDLSALASEPSRLALIQQAFAFAESTPWALGYGLGHEPGTVEPHIRLLMAEVQARCSRAFVETDASAREEQLTRDNARLRLKLATSLTTQSALERFATAVIGSSPTESFETWSDRSAVAWCGEPGVTSATIVRPGDEPTTSPFKSPTANIPLGDPVSPFARVYLWHADGPPSRGELSPVVLDSWNSWARVIAERVRLESVVDGLVTTHRRRIEREETVLRRSKIEALAEFAAGAGHELNNPLAVILGRAQLLMTREDDPDALRSLRAIVAQSQRAHRILRDLMYFARPPEPRPRPCSPDEIVRASLRDLQPEAEARGVRLTFESNEPPMRVWVDPDPLRQVADVITRNALEASTIGGSIRFVSRMDHQKMRWTIHDNGRGVTSIEGSHLFDPFYCGRQAGRGLGLGLSRVARIVEQLGGELRWRSSLGVGSTFHVTLPIQAIPIAVELEKPGDAKVDRALLRR